MVLNDEQYNRIERIYEIRRDENEAALSSRRDEVYAKVPELKSLDNEIADLSLACSMRLLSMTDESERSSLGDDLQTKIDAIEDRKLRLITAAGFPDDYLEMTYHCDKCKDTEANVPATGSSKPHFCPMNPASAPFSTGIIFPDWTSISTKMRIFPVSGMLYKKVNNL